MREHKRGAYRRITVLSPLFPAVRPWIYGNIRQGLPPRSPERNGCPVRCAGWSGRCTPCPGAGAGLQGRPGRAPDWCGAALSLGL